MCNHVLLNILPFFSAEFSSSLQGLLFHQVMGIMLQKPVIYCNFSIFRIRELSLSMTGRGVEGIFFLLKYVHVPENFFQNLMPQLQIIELFYTPVSLVEEAIVPKALHAMTIGPCIVQLGSSGCTDSLPTGPGQSPGGDQGAKSPKNCGNTAFYDTKNCPENHSFFSFLHMFLTQIYRKIYCGIYPG